MKDIDFARPIFGDDERDAVNRVMKGYWLASGQENETFEREFAEFIGVPYAVCVNSGSSANLLALAALDLPKGSKVLTSACGFPATLAPILHLGLEPVLVDYDIRTHNIDIAAVNDALDKHNDTRAIILAHTMGVPVDLYGLGTRVAIIEDCCEALGASYDTRQVGSIGDLGTYSFYPSHQMTALGGGGMVVCKDESLFRRLRSLRDWGKAPEWNSYGRNNTKYERTVDGIPYFLHYVYEAAGYNMKLPEANAAFGRIQLKRIPEFVAARRRLHDALLAQLDTEHLLPHVVPNNANPSWFGVVLTTRSTIDRDRFGDYLEAHGVRHRPFFAGNITRHSPFKGLGGEYPIADYLMQQSLFVGCWPGLTQSDIDYMAEQINNGLTDARRMA